MTTTARRTASLARRTLRETVLLVLPHGGQRGARRNALAAVHALDTRARNRPLVAAELERAERAGRAGHPAGTATGR